MPDPLETVLRLVAAGQLSPDDGARILDALAAAGRARDEAVRAASHVRDVAGRTAERLRTERANTRPGGRQVRIHVREAGRDVLDVRVPFTVATLAGDVIPGLSDEYRARLRQALDTGRSGPILEVHDERSDVRIDVE